jgi:hypothetical protein
MWKICCARPVKDKSKRAFPSLPNHVISVLGMAFSPQAHSGLANVAYFARGCFCYSKAVFQQFPSKSSSLLLEFNCPELKDNEGSLGVAE